MTIEIRDIDTYYGTSHILHTLSFTVKDKDLFAILGRNGAGKTTLLRSIIGLNPPRGGEIRFNETDITRLKPHMRSHLGISYVPQGREIIPDLTVEENILVSLIGVGKSARRIPDLVYDYFPALHDIRKRQGGVLSGGQQQQLAIGRALAQQPQLLLLDEPTEGLQPSVVEEIDEIIKRISSEQNCTVLLVEQNLDFVRDTMKDFAILDTGHIVAQGSIDQLTDELAHQHLSV